MDEQDIFEFIQSLLSKDKVERLKALGDGEQLRVGHSCLLAKRDGDEIVFVREYTIGTLNIPKRTED